MNEPTKKCSICGIPKPLTEYHKDKSRKSGYQHRCKICVNILSREAYIKNRQKRLNQVSEYNAKNRDARKKYMDIYLAVNKESLAQKQKNRRLNNLAEHRQRDREKAKNNPERTRLYAKRYYAKYPERVLNRCHHRRERLKQNGIYKITNKELKILRLSLCFSCGDSRLITIDHIIPVSRGGRHSIGNLISLCRKCNSQKGNKTWMEYRLWKLKNINEEQ